MPSFFRGAWRFLASRWSAPRTTDGVKRLAALQGRPPSSCRKPTADALANRGLHVRGKQNHPTFAVERDLHGYPRGEVVSTGSRGGRASGAGGAGRRVRLAVLGLLKCRGVDAGAGTPQDAVPDASRISPPVLLPGYPNPVRLSLSVEFASSLYPHDLRSSTPQSRSDLRRGFPRLGRAVRPTGKDGLEPAEHVDFPPLAGAEWLTDARSKQSTSRSGWFVRGWSGQKKVTGDGQRCRQRKKGCRQRKTVPDTCPALVRHLFGFR